MSSNRKAAASLHDIRADALVCDISTSIVLRGAQEAAVWRGEDSQGRHVACQVGRVLIYLFGIDAISSHLKTWKRAEKLAERAFPEGYEARGPRNSNVLDRPLSVGTAVLQCERKQQPARADAATTAAAGLPYVQVHVGRLIVVCLDGAAVASAFSAWETADEQTAGWLHDPETAQDQELVIAAFEKRRVTQPRRRRAVPQ